MPPVLTPIPFTLWWIDRAAFAAALGRSLRDIGFAVVSEHPMDEGVLQRGLAAAQGFFALPEPVKRAYIDPNGGGQRGYTPFAVETAKGAVRPDLKEFWHVGREGAPGLPANLHVREIEGWREATLAMFDALDRFGASLLQAVALDLALPEDFFTDPVREGDSILRLLHYPAQPEPPSSGSVRAGAHEDINVITLLRGAEEGGLEALHRNGVWTPVNPPAGSLVVNVGDMLERLTNRVLPSTTHRVVNPSPERAMHARYSTPFFLHFRPDYLIRTLPSCIGPGRPDAFPDPILAGDFLRQRLVEIGLLPRDAD